MRALLRRALDGGGRISAPAGAVAQAWRGGPRQARVARLLGDPIVAVAPLDDVTVRAVRLLCGRSGHADVTDVHVALLAREQDAVIVTSDPHDLAQFDPAAELVVV